VTALRDDPDGTVAAYPSSTTTRADYVERVCAGGFPLALRRAAIKRGKKLDPRSLIAAAFMIIVTSLPRQGYTAKDILAVYRLRWQIELAFKRLKQLLAAGHVPKTTDASSRAWLQAKIVTALLIEHMIHAGRFFSPWGYRLPAGTAMAGVQGSSR